MEKRRLMKLLQQCYTSGLGSLASTINEKELTASRSLLRPQNAQNAQNAQKAQKGISVENETEIDAEAEAEAEIEANVDFPTYLATRHSISPSSLSSTIILYALCLNQLGPLSPSPSLPSSFAALFSQLSSLGRYAEQGVRTGVLVPMYGGGEIGQGFCRMGAVNGVTYLLRRGGERIVFKTSRARASARVSGHLPTENDGGPCLPRSPIRTVKRTKAKQRRTRMQTIRTAHMPPSCGQCSGRRRRAE